MSTLTLLVGHPSSGKTTLAKTRAAHTNALLLSADAIAAELGDGTNVRDRHEAVEAIVRERIRPALASGRPVVLDSTHRAPKYRHPWLVLAKMHNYRTEALYVNRSLEQITAFNTARADGRRLSAQALRKYERHLQIPTLAERIDHIEVVYDEPEDTEAAAFFATHENRLLLEPAALIRELEADGRLARWLPELHRAIPVDQHNPHHRFTVYEHILKATEVVARSSLKLVWTMLLHDIGKAYPGIKQFTGSLVEAWGPFRRKERVIIENGADILEGRDTGGYYLVKGQKIPRDLVTTNLNGHFYEHENIGAQLAYRILRRLGKPHAFAYEVATLIQFHMLMPRGIEEVDLSQIHTFYEKTGPYAADLMMVRLADNRGK